VTRSKEQEVERLLLAISASLRLGEPISCRRFDRMDPAFAQYCPGKVLRDMCSDRELQVREQFHGARDSYIPRPSYSPRRRAAARYFLITWMSHPTVDTGIELIKKYLAATRRRGA
jgi:hypothetical protein